MKYTMIIASALGVMGLLSSIVSAIVQGTKELPGIKAIPTKLYTIIVGVLLCLAAATVSAIKLAWTPLWLFMILGAFAGVIVGTISSVGWDTFYEAVKGTSKTAEKIASQINESIAKIANTANEAKDNADKALNAVDELLGKVGLSNAEIASMLKNFTIPQLAAYSTKKGLNVEMKSDAKLADWYSAVLTALGIEVGETS